jgi:hypothetical protein
MAKPVAETPPAGLDAYWLGAWLHVLKTLKTQKTWAWEQKPLVDEYIFALVHARIARLEGEMKTWGNLATRASALADQLALTPRGRKAVGIKLEEAKDAKQDQDPFAELDELERKRQSKVKAS